MKHVRSLSTAVTALALLAPHGAHADRGPDSGDFRPIIRAGSVSLQGSQQEPSRQGSGEHRRLQSWYSLKYYLSADAVGDKDYASGRSMVVERKGDRVFVTIRTMQGTPSCFKGTKSGSTFYGEADSGHPPYRNWTLKLTNIRRGVIVAFSHGGSRPYPEKYRDSSKAGIKRMFGWNAVKDHQHYQRQCTYT